MRNEIESWFSQHEDEFVRDLSKLISVMSVSGVPEDDAPYGRGPKNALLAASELFSDYGFEPHIFENKLVYADLNGKPQKLGILSHLDTVGVADGWSTYPFELTVKNGVCFGRGVSDDKGPALSAMYALRCIKDICPELSANCRILLGSDEETGSDDVASYMAKNAMPEYVFTPDADFPVINTEKGRLSHVFGRKWAKKESGAAILSISGGNTVNVVPHAAEAVVSGISADIAEKACGEYAEKTGADFSFTVEGENIRISCVGTASHAAEPEHGNNAQTALCAMLASLPICGEDADSVRSICRLFPHGMTGGEGFCADMSDDTGRLTLSFDVLNMDETGFSAAYDARLPVSADISALIAKIEDMLNDEKFGILKTTTAESHHTPAESEIVKTLLGVYEEYTGEKGECLAIGGGTYVHEIEGGVAFGCVFPGKNTAMHGADEHIELKDLILSGKMFAQAIYDLCK